MEVKREVHFDAHLNFEDATRQDASTSTIQRELSPPVIHNNYVDAEPYFEQLNKKSHL